MNQNDLAINGGPKAVTNKLVGWPNISEEAIAAVVEVLRTNKINYWTGPTGMEFEKKFADWQGSKFAVSVNSGTSALHVALSAIGIGPGDEVIVPSYTFIATSFAVVQAGAIPRFADVNIEDHCISMESAEKLVNERTRAIIPVHLYGNVCEMDEISAFANAHNLYVLEDNAQAFGGSYKGKRTGTIGDIAACSFCQNKTFTTGGEGGMVTTDIENFAWNARSFRDHGYNVAERLGVLEMETKLPYIHDMVGWNYRMTNMQAAIGLTELGRMDNWNMPNRRRNAHIIMQAIKDYPVVKYLPIDTEERANGWFSMAISLDVENMNCDIKQYVDAVAAEGAPCWVVFWPQCHTEKAYQKHHAFGNSGFPFTSKEYTDHASVDYSNVEIPNALWHQTHTFTCFPYPTFTEEDCQQIGAALAKVIAAYQK